MTAICTSRVGSGSASRPNRGYGPPVLRSRTSVRAPSTSLDAGRREPIGQLVKIPAEGAKRAHWPFVPVGGDRDDVKRRADVDAGGMEVSHSSSRALLHASRSSNDPDRERRAPPRPLPRPAVIDAHHPVSSSLKSAS
jgi:hypothetical protein